MVDVFFFTLNIDTRTIERSLLTSDEAEEKEKQKYMLTDLIAKGNCFCACQEQE